MGKDEENSGGSRSGVEKDTRKQQADRGRKEAEVWKIEDKVILSMKDLMFKEWLVKRLVDQYVGSYTIDKVVFTNAVKLWLLTLMRIHSVVNVSWIV